MYHMLYNHGVILPKFKGTVLSCHCTDWSTIDTYEASET